jgi:hypothetical protein
MLTASPSRTRRSSPPSARSTWSCSAIWRGCWRRSWPSSPGSAGRGLALRRRGAGRSWPARARRGARRRARARRRLLRGRTCAPTAGAEAMVLADGTTRWRWRGAGRAPSAPRRHNVRNALLALGVAEAWGVRAGGRGPRARAMPQPKLRGEWNRIGGMRVLADCYNANPPSVRAAIDLLASLPAEGREGRGGRHDARARERRRRAAPRLGRSARRGWGGGSTGSSRPASSSTPFEPRGRAGDRSSSRRTRSRRTRPRAARCGRRDDPAEGVARRGAGALAAAAADDG